MSQEQAIEGYATPEQAATWLGLTPRQLKRLRVDGDGPRPTAFGYRTIRYAWVDVYRYAARRRENNHART